ncbi:Uncharacterised protein [uncultured archaeon]|nr:Uncharacterised protein [uncultured archaeon]
MAEPKYVYALCRHYSVGMNPDDREIVVGIEKSSFLANTFDLFRTKRGEYVARFEEVSRAKGCVIGKITDSLKEWKAMRVIPIDDLVDACEIVSGVT